MVPGPVSPSMIPRPVSAGCRCPRYRLSPSVPIIPRYGHYHHHALRFLQPVNGTKLETINCLVFQFTARALLLAAGCWLGCTSRHSARRWVTLLCIYELAPDHQHSEPGASDLLQTVQSVEIDISHHGTKSVHFFHRVRWSAEIISGGVFKCRLQPSFIV